MTHHGDGTNGQAKDEALAKVREDSAGTFLTTNQGLRISDTDNSLKAGTRGPTLMEDFHFREKMTHFDHEPFRSEWYTPAARRRTTPSGILSR